MSPIAEELHEASYKGATFFVDGASTVVGRKLVKKSIPASDKQIIEDLGLSPNVYQLRGFVAAERKADGTEITSYKDARDRLISALTEGGPGVLVHPWYGPLAKMVAGQGNTVGEDVSELGVARVVLSFELATSDGRPQVATIDVGDADAGNTAVNDAAEDSITDDFDVTPGFAGNFSDAETKLDGYIKFVEKSASTFSQPAEKVNEFAQTISDFSNRITTLINAPAELADSMRNVYATMNASYASVKGAFAAFSGMFGYGDDDVGFAQDTAGRVERQSNRDTLNSNVQSTALSYAYLNASEFDFVTVDDIEATADLLEEQYQKLAASDAIDSDVLNELTDLRTTMQGLFDDQKLRARQVITVTTVPLPTRVLAYRWYGSSDLGNQLATLNGLTDSARIGGEVSILSE